DLRPDLGRDAPPLRERVVARHRAVVLEAHDLAEIRLKVLRRVELLALAGADPEMAVAERDAVAVMPVARDFRHLAPDHVEILEQAAAGLVEHEPRPRDGRAARAAFAGLRITHVYEPVLRIGRVQ